MKINEYSEHSSLMSNDYVLIDSENWGTRRILFKNALESALAMMSTQNLYPGAERNFIRGKNLGTTVTADQRNMIRIGNFMNFFVGDYWVINGIKWVIVDIDYWWHCGDTTDTRVDTHHLVIMPEERIDTGVMNDESTTDGGYANSKMRTSVLDNAKEMILNAFGDLVLTRREYLIDDAENGCPTSGNWYNSQVEIPDEIMVYGCRIHSPANDGSAYQKLHTTSKTQLALFRLCPNHIFNTGSYWLRDVVSKNSFATVQSTGVTSYSQANTTTGIRPVFAIGSNEIV